MVPLSDCDSRATVVFLLPLGFAMATDSVSSMILRCEKTGKLLYSEAEAKVHADETGYSDFAQVSPEEKVWVCAETGKVCFNETQVGSLKISEAIASRHASLNMPSTSNLRRWICTRSVCQKPSHGKRRQFLTCVRPRRS